MKAADIDDAQFLGAVLVGGFVRSHAWNTETTWATTLDVAAMLEKTYPDVPDKVRQAKAKALVRRGLIDGCTCGCRGDFELTEKGWRFLYDHILPYYPEGYRAT